MYMMKGTGRGRCCACVWGLILGLLLLGLLIGLLAGLLPGMTYIIGATALQVYGKVNLNWCFRSVA